MSESSAIPTLPPSSVQPSIGVVCSKPDEGGSKSELLWRIQNYLELGGLFNPEMMEHEKVRNLIMDCREYISKT